MNNKIALWSDVKKYTDNAHSIAYDNCHKIYVNMDEVQTEYVKDYPVLITLDDMDPEGFFEIIKQWYEDSCDLRFINACESQRNGHTRFIDLVAQFDEII